MKTVLVFALLAFATASWGQPAVSAEGAKQPPAKAIPAPAKKDDGKKQDDKVGKIDGMEIARGEGFIGVQVVNGVFKVRAYNAKKKPVAADFTRVALRWNVQYQKAPERAVLLPTGAVGEFSSEKVVKPPHSFKLFITLIKGEGDDAPVENHQIDFKAS